MANQPTGSGNPPQGGEDTKEGTEIIIRVQIKGDQTGSNVVIARASSNHYTSRAYTSDTCCTCQSS